MTDLCCIMAKYGSDKAPPQKHNYTPLYHKIFEKLRYEKLRVFELGLGSRSTSVNSNMSGMPESYQPGASHRGWQEYFPNSQIFGADIDHTILFREPRINTYYCDQTNPTVIDAMWKQLDLHETMDIIIEDGLHEFSANITFFENSIMKTRQYYCIEDIDQKDIQNFNNKITEWFSTGRYTDCTFWLYELSPKINDDNVLVVEKNRDIGSKPYFSKLREHWNCVTKLAELMDETINQWKGCGSYMIDGRTTSYQRAFYDKQELLWEATLDCQHILEIGVHGGHSLLIMLLANPKLNIVAVDPCYFAHTEKCVQYLQEAFPASNITLIKAKGLDVIQTFEREQFDLIHLDGDHEYWSTRSEMECATYLNPKTIVFDDYDGPYINKVLREHKMIPDKVSSFPYRNCLIEWNQKPQTTTLVTAYFKLDGYRSMDVFLNAGKRIFSSAPDVNWIVYTDQEAELLSWNLQNIKVIPMKFEDLLKFHQNLMLSYQTFNLPSERNLGKDTVEYMIVQNSKFKLVQEAFNLTDNNGFAWIDFGLMQHIPDRDRSMGFLLHQLSRQNIDKLYMPGYTFHENQTNLCDKPIWTFCGTSFVGNKTSINKFCDVYYEILNTYLIDNKITWEVNLWHETYRRDRGLISHYHVVDNKLSMFEGLLKVC